ncbi:MAG: hypothetical protein ACK4TA_14340 [Saprospiraceae bacterium]
MIAYQNIYDSLAEFMASLDPQKVLDFHAPEDIQQRVEALLEKQKEEGLSSMEAEELDHYFILEHIVRLAKSRARLLLSQTAA